MPANDHLMILRTEGATATIDLKAGGRLSSLQIMGREVLKTGSGQGTLWGCFPMVPWAGRVRRGQFSWNGERIQLPLGLPPHAIHGTVYDAPWDTLDDTTIRCALGPDWPWKGQVTSRFELEPGQLTWRLVVESFEGPMPAMVGWHPWFLRDIDGRGPVALQFDAETMYVRDTEGMPDGTTQEVTAGPWDDCFTGLKGDPTLTWPDGLTLTLTSTCDHWVVYDEPQDALCIEPQSGPPDAFNLDKTTLATPDAPVEHTMTLRWS